MEKGPVLSQFLNVLQLPYSKKLIGTHSLMSCLSTTRLPFEPTMLEKIRVSTCEI